MRFWLQTYDDLRGTVDHVIPLSAGGTHTWENVVLACRSCNVRKNARSADEWRTKLASG